MVLLIFLQFNQGKNPLKNYVTVFLRVFGVIVQWQRGFFEIMKCKLIVTTKAKRQSTIIVNLIRGSPCEWHVPIDECNQSRTDWPILVNDCTLNNIHAFMHIVASIDCLASSIRVQPSESIQFYCCYRSK